MGKQLQRLRRTRVSRPHRTDHRTRLPFPPGDECYAADAGAVRARGLKWPSEALGNDAGAAVGDALWDRPGMDEDREFLLSLGATGFAAERIQEVLGSNIVQDSVETWRVGEAVAQVELEANRDCSFPWNVRRDLKNPRASHAGAELVGFHQRPSGSTCFAFGEVKTSSHEQRPPSVTTDLRRQMRALRGTTNTVNNLVRYLTPRARGVSWQAQFVSAWQTFCLDRRDYAIFGVLVRDVTPDRRDIAGMASDLAEELIAPTTLELRALYLPDIAALARSRGAA
jgi:hypothetical protein